jgi:CubicO group peptidase (beta-lactamase class C family)
MIEDRVATAIRAHVDAGELAGAAALVWRNRKALVTTVGWRNVDARLLIERDTTRLLRLDTLKMMASNRLTDHQRTTSKMLGLPIFASGHGFGMGVAVVMEPDKADPLRCGGGIGSVGWPGAYGGWWQADPNDGSVMIFLAHSMVRLDQLAKGIGLGVWGAISQFQALGSDSPRSHRSGM